MNNLHQKQQVTDFERKDKQYFVITGIMVNRHYEKKKEVKFGNGTGSPLSDHYFLSACSEINSHFNQKEESTETSIVSSLPFYSVSKF